MSTAQITIEVDADAAKAFAAAPAEQRRKIQLLLSLRLQDLTAGPSKPLRDVLDEIGASAAGRGLTPEKLDALLGDE